MNLDDLLHHYVGTGDPADALGRIAVDFGVERDAGRRFALWSLMHVLGGAPDPETAFKTAREREAACNFARMMARAEEADDPAS